MATFSKEQWGDIVDGIKRSNRESLMKPLPLQCNKCLNRIRSIEAVKCKEHPDGIPKKFRVNETECPAFRLKTK